MASSTEREGKNKSCSDTDLLLHPELLSEDFMQLLLSEKKISTRGCESRDRLTELYLRHVMPLPQRTLPDSRWGRRVERTRGRQHAPDSSSNDHIRKRPLIVFDGSSSHSAPLKVRKPEATTVSTGITDRLKPPPATNLSNPIRKLSGTTPSSSSSSHVSSNQMPNLKREANSSDGLKSPEVKKKIQHVTWP
ncbi:ashwin [Myripristis murdjan]|uniref:ashwin n=1 Tax=Myripristis murdjan TaxID=586833 RepID=UPI001175CB7A|nr:ashwin [Myripristis murdjan]